MKTPDIRAARNHSNQEATVGAMLPAQQAAVAHDTTKSIESPDVLSERKRYRFVGMRTIRIKHRN